MKSKLPVKKHFILQHKDFCVIKHTNFFLGVNYSIIQLENLPGLKVVSLSLNPIACLHTIILKIFTLE